MAACLDYAGISLRGNRGRGYRPSKLESDRLPRRSTLWRSTLHGRLPFASWNCSKRHAQHGNHLACDSFDLSEFMHEGKLIRTRRIAMFIFSCCIVFIAGCRGGNLPETYAAATGGDAQRGAALISSFNCGACHVIPGIRRAEGQVGPPLTSFGRRTFIAGVLPNNPNNLALWIASPTSVDPKTAMPALGLSDQQARDVAAYLYTLQ